MSPTHDGGLIISATFLGTYSATEYFDSSGSSVWNIGDASAMNAFAVANYSDTWMIGGGSNTGTYSNDYVIKDVIDGSHEGEELSSNGTAPFRTYYTTTSLRNKDIYFGGGAPDAPEDTATNAGNFDLSGSISTLSEDISGVVMWPESGAVAQGKLIMSSVKSSQANKYFRGGKRFINSKLHYKPLHV